MGSVHASLFFVFLFFCFQGCQPLLFKDLTLALQSNKKPFGKLIRLGKLFRFLMQLRWQKFNIPLARTGESRRKCASSPVSRRRPEDLCWSRCKQEVLAFHPAGSPAVDVLLFSRRDGSGNAFHVRSLTFLVNLLHSRLSL